MRVLAVIVALLGGHPVVRRDSFWCGMASR